MPPLITIRSDLSQARRSVCVSLSRLSPTWLIQKTSTPSSDSDCASHGALVSTRWPRSSSVPTDRISPFIYPPATDYLVGGARRDGSRDHGRGQAGRRFGWRP